MKNIFYLLLAFTCLTCEAPTSIDPIQIALYDYKVETKIKELGIELVTPKAPSGANIVRAVRSGNLLFLSGKGPTKPDGENITGKVGAELDTQAGYEAARIVAINQLAVLKAELGDLNKVVRLVKVFGMVNASPEFTDHSKVVNGFSDLMIEVFGERGKHARAAVGMVSLPGNIAVEVDLVLEVRD